MTRAPIEFNTNCSTTKTTVIHRMTAWLAGLRFQLNHRWVRTVMYDTTPVSTLATVARSATP